jgi:hypothetical protein
MEAIMKAIKVLSDMLLVLLLATASTVVSQEKNSPAKSSYTYDEANQKTVEGWVVETKDFQCPVSGTLGSHITVRSETGTIEVHLAPASFMKQYDISFSKNDKVTGRWSQDHFEGKTALIAKSVTIGRETFNFRDSKGRSLW